MKNNRHEIYSFCFFITAVDCDDLNSPDNGVVSLDGTRVANSVATYQCNTGYMISWETLKDAALNWASGREVSLSVEVNQFSYASLRIASIISRPGVGSQLWR